MSDEDDISGPPRLVAETFNDAPSVGRWESLEPAFAAHGFPLANLALVQRLADGIGIDHYEGIASRSYLKGIRTGPGRTLMIAYGYTGGLDSEEEIVAVVGAEAGREGSPDGRRWWLHHPVNQMRAGDEARLQQRTYGACPSCGIEMPASRRCDVCDG